ncbi:LIF receptor subunit alpha a [Fundulus heteroclitus]|uniref:LIF receptor subunit alpha a n=1 Tax=Fundulus heteroclitus TaxID=8078 RepID=UPI00165CDFCE|nr:LIF receptor subunit alpha a [Fundulus heteroclitus]
MPRLLNSPTSKSNCGPVWVALVLLGISALNTQAKTVLSVPQQVSLSPNFPTQQLSISWLGGEATTFDLIIFTTEFKETIFSDTVSAVVNQDSGRHQWTWTSVEPLECTSLSVQIRSREGETTSEWSEPQILEGKDLPSNSEAQMFPQDRIVPAGANTTFCCIVEEGKEFKSIRYENTNMPVKRLSRRSYAITAIFQEATRITGSNVICHSNGPITGATIFVGYPPLPSWFKCETRDLISAVCHWDKGRYTNLGGRRRTRYSVNNRDCSERNMCALSQWDGNWTLVAANPLGQYNLTDSAELSHRVYPVAPLNLSHVAHAWNATLFWEWTHSSYSSLALVCQVELAGRSTTVRDFFGVGLRSVFLTDLHPDEKYSVQVRCGAQNNFWKWGDWSELHHFKTKPYAPDAPSVWLWLTSDNTGLIVWKPLTRLQSHGKILRYSVTVGNAGKTELTESLSPENHSFPVNLTRWASLSHDNRVRAAVVAENVAGTSPPAIVPLRFRDVEPPALAQAAHNSSGFSLSWQQNAGSTCSYVVEWCETLCLNCSVDWIRLDAGNTNVSIPSANLLPGVRYNFSLYGCPSDFPVLMQRWQGYKEELPPSRVELKIAQLDCDVVLSWEEVPLEKRRGFLLGYNVYISNSSQLTLLEKLDASRRTYTVSGLPAGSYKFVVKAYTSGGEGTDSIVSIRLEPCGGLILPILTSMGIVTLLLATVALVCYKKRRWVKTAFYPDIPEPKLPGDWSRTQEPMDVKPFPHSIVHILEKPERDPYKDALVVIPEEEVDDHAEGTGDGPVDVDERQSLRYYNQVVDERPIRPRYPDSSASSLSSVDSANTDVTYTGISEGFQPHTGPSMSSGATAGGYQPQMRPVTLGGNQASPEPLVEPQVVGCGGYKPQSSWLIDSPTEADERMSPTPSLGSPTSVASTHFLLSDREGDEQERRQTSSSAAAWLTNLLFSAKP